MEPCTVFVPPPMLMCPHSIICGDEVIWPVSEESKLVAEYDRIKSRDIEVEGCDHGRRNRTDGAAHDVATIVEGAAAGPIGIMLGYDLQPVVASRNIRNAEGAVRVPRT